MKTILIVVVLMLSISCGHCETATPNDSLAKCQATLAAMDVPTMAKLQDGTKSGKDLYEAQKYKEAVPVLLNAYRVGLFLFDTMNCNIDRQKQKTQSYIIECRASGTEYRTSEIYVACLQNESNSYNVSMDIGKQMNECTFYIGMSYRKIGDDKSALPYLISTAKASRELFDEAWAQIEEITGIRVPKQDNSKVPS